MQPLKTTESPSSESTIGWWPRLERSMMARRRCPRATPPADHTPAPSGPRAAMASALRYLPQYERLLMGQRSRNDGLSPPPFVEEVSDGIYAYLQLAGQWGLNNSGFLVGSRAVTLVDTCFTERRTRALLDAVRLLSGHPIRTLFNT